MLPGYRINPINLITWPGYSFKYFREPMVEKMDGHWLHATKCQCRRDMKSPFTKFNNTYMQLHNYACQWTPDRPQPFNYSGTQPAASINPIAGKVFA